MMAWAKEVEMERGRIRKTIGKQNGQVWVKEKYEYLVVWLDTREGLNWDRKPKKEVEKEKSLILV